MSENILRFDEDNQSSDLNMQENDLNDDDLFSFDDDFDFDNIDYDYNEYRDEYEESRQLYEDALKAYEKIDNKIIEYIDNFVKAQNNIATQKHKLKRVFFWIIMIVFVLVVITPIIALIILYYIRPNNTVVILGAVTAPMIEVLVAVIILPKIVAEYLFNKEEDIANVKIVELMKAYSETMHGYENKKIN